MKKIVTALCLVFCFLFVAACGKDIETTATSESETSTTLDASNYQYADIDMYEIETSVVTLMYPAKWKDVVEVEVTDDGAEFSNEGIELFAIMFVEPEEGYYLGTYNGTPIYLEVPQNELTDEQLEMQSDINAIIENIEKDSNFNK